MLAYKYVLSIVYTEIVIRSYYFIYLLKTYYLLQATKLVWDVFLSCSTQGKLTQLLPLECTAD